jgi:hypothetical protein
MIAEQPEAPAAIAIEHEILAEQAHAEDRLGVELAGTGDGMPVTPEKLAHGRASTDASEPLVFFGGQHRSLPEAGWRRGPPATVIVRITSQDSGRERLADPIGGTLCRRVDAVFLLRNR